MKNIGSNEKALFVHDIPYIQIQVKLVTNQQIVCLFVGKKNLRHTFDCDNNYDNTQIVFCFHAHSYSSNDL